MIKRKLESLLLQIVMWLMVLCFIAPLAWLLLTSLKNRADAFSMPPKWIFTPTFSNYASILQDGTFVSNYFNSIQVGVLATLLSLILGIPTAYALSRFKIKGKEDIAFWILTTRMAPPIMVILPFYLIFKEFNLLDTVFSLVIVYMLINMAFVVWMMRNYFDSIPIDLEESARVDGASRLKAFTKVVLPLSGPGIAASGIFSFIMSWNEFLFAFVLTGEHTKTAPVSITSFMTFEGIRWGEIAAGGILIILPVVVFGIVIQKYLIEGLTMGSIK